MTSDQIQQFKNLANLIFSSHSLKDSRIFHNANNIEIQVSATSLADLYGLCVTYSFEYQERPDSVIIKIDDLAAIVPVYLGTDELMRQCKVDFNKNSSFIQQNYCIIEPIGTYVIVKDASSVVHDDGLLKKAEYILSFFHMAYLLKQLADYYDVATQTFVLFTSNKGVEKIKLGDIDLTPNHIALYENRKMGRLDDELNDPRKRDFIKSAIIEQVAQSESRSVESVLSRLSNVLEDSIRNHQLYMEQFSFEKFKSGWDKEKEKYFEKFRDVITKVTAQMANLPIALIAFVITTNDKLTNPRIEAVFYSIFSVYVFVTMYIQIFNLVELFGIYHKLKTDASTIAQRFSQTHDLIKKDSRELICKSITLMVLSSVIIIAFAIVSTMVFLNCIRR